ncbi:MAG TPA: TlpA disulfide reductase family protein [Longimicrobiales bacterium]|nr:TlpA disulfide reductase family protein [Longimicrobiales bacterium]
MRRSSGALLLSAALAWGCVPTEIDGPRVGSEAPAYGGTTLAGDSVALDGFRGQVVLLNLWATWCAPCRHETPFLEALFKERKEQGLTIVGVSMDTGDARDQVAEFVQEFSVTYPILLDPQMRGMDLYRVLGLPASFLIDRDGTLRWMRIGPVAEDDQDFLNALESTLQ